MLMQTAMWCPQSFQIHLSKLHRTHVQFTTTSPKCSRFFYRSPPSSDYSGLSSPSPPPSPHLRSHVSDLTVRSISFTVFFANQYPTLVNADAQSFVNLCLHGRVVVWMVGLRVTENCVCNRFSSSLAHALLLNSPLTKTALMVLALFVYVSILLLFSLTKRSKIHQKLWIFVGFDF